MGQVVAILGASNNPERFSFKAFQMLKEYQHLPLPISPKMASLEGTKVFATINDITESIDTLTMYVGPETSTKLGGDILNAKPRRVIFNPGSENPVLQKELEQAGVHVVQACTLVLLRTNQFDRA